MKNLTASDRAALIRLASSLPVGSAHRRAILTALQGVHVTAAGGPPVLSNLVNTLTKNRPGLKVDFQRGQKSYYYGASREIIPAVRYAVDLSGDGIGLQISVLVDKQTNQVVSGPDASVSSPQFKKLIGSDIGKAEVQDPRRVLQLIEGALSDTRSEKAIPALREIVLDAAKVYAYRKPEVTVSPKEITVSWWGESGDDPPGWLSQRDADRYDPNSPEAIKDMAHRTRIHDGFLRDLREVLARSPYASMVSQIGSVYGVPEDGEHYDFHVQLKS